MEHHPTDDGGPGRPVIIGAGPAGLTAARELARHGVRSTVLESTEVVGGISRTVVRDGWRFDIGGHRFFTKVRAVSDFWHELLGDEEFLERPRMSRIYYDGNFYDYPLNPSNALRNLGVVEAVRCVASYARARVRPPGDQSTFEGYVAAKFGWRLYNTFFKTYTEKVWGVPAETIQADWAAQRIKNLDLRGAIVNALRPGRGRNDPTSLIDRFEYPRLGPGMMWERCHDLVVAAGTDVRFRHRVRRIRHESGRAVSVVAAGPDGDIELTCSDVVSSMPLPLLVEAMDPPPPAEVLESAKSLTFRDFLTVALVVPAEAAFPDNWIYVHEPEVRVGRIQNYGAWSPHMVRDEGYTCLGLEYFVFEGDDLWTASDADLISLATGELEVLGLVDTDLVRSGYVTRMPKAYPMYDAGYQERVEILRGWLDANTSNVHPVGRNGMHRYNNQDHSMFTAMLTVENIVMGTHHDVWSVNVDAEYHEELSGGLARPSRARGPDRPGAGDPV
ncbi:MAG: NAD(P)/FAD-dependent oxidoreductase [Acidimicrobiales bacterium]